MSRSAHDDLLSRIDRRGLPSKQSTRNAQRPTPKPNSAWGVGSWELIVFSGFRVDRGARLCAKFQSRFSVESETPSASAASRSLRPLKYRSSTTRLARGSIDSSRDSASSSARTSSGRSPAATSTSVSEIARRPSPRFLCISRARVVHEDVPHLARNGREEVGPALPVHLRRSEQPHVHLVDEAGCPQRVAGPLLPHVVGGNATELRVDQCDQFFSRRGVALAQLRDQRRHAGRGFV